MLSPHRTHSHTLTSEHTSTGGRQSGRAHSTHSGSPRLTHASTHGSSRAILEDALHAEPLRWTYNNSSLRHGTHTCLGPKAAQAHTHNALADNFTSTYPSPQLLPQHQLTSQLAGTPFAWKRPTIRWQAARQRHSIHPHIVAAPRAADANRN